MSQLQRLEVGKTPRSEDVAIPIEEWVEVGERPITDEPVGVHTAETQISDRGGEQAQDLCGVSGPF